MLYLDYLYIDESSDVVSPTCKFVQQIVFVDCLLAAYLHMWFLCYSYREHKKVTYYLFVYVFLLLF